MHGLERWSLVISGANCCAAGLALLENAWSLEDVFTLFHDLASLAKLV